jgi:hypothetical protein
LVFVTPVDTSDTVSLTIAGLPAGATVSATDINGNFISQGTDNHDGSWTLTESQAFEVNPGPPLFYMFSPKVTLPSGTVLADLTLTGTETTTTGVPIHSTPFSFQYDLNAAKTPTVTVNLTQGFTTPAPQSQPLPFRLDEATTVPFDISFDPIDPLGDSIAITGLPSGYTLSAGTLNPDGSCTLTSAQLAGLTLTTGEPTPLVYEDIGVGHLVGVPSSVPVTVRVTSSLGASFWSGGKQFPLWVYAVAPTLTIANDSLRPSEGVPIPLGITETPADPLDPVVINITGVPASDSLSAGTLNPDGSWTLTPAQLANLTLTAGVGAAPTATLTVTATNTASLTHRAARPTRMQQFRRRPSH